MPKQFDREADYPASLFASSAESSCVVAMLENPQSLHWTIIPIALL